MSPILIRTISGAIYIILMLGSVVLGSYIFGAVQLVFLLLCLLEFQKMYSGAETSVNKTGFIFSGVLSYLIVLLFLWQVWNIKFVLLIIPVIFILIISELYRKNKLPILSLGISILGLIYIVVPFVLLNFFFYTEMNYASPTGSILAGFFIVIWGNDTFAYLSGMALGKHKLFERISPKKTWEGVLGGALFSIITAVVLSYFFSAYTIFEWIGFALTIVIFGTFGDLFESLIKRTLGLKDSGNMMPGHGGILDRFDSILMAAPFAYTYIVFVLN